MSGCLAYLGYEVTFWSSFTLLTLGWSLRVRGRRHIPRTGPALVIANHQSFIDPILVGLASPRHLCFLARKTLFRHRTFGRLITSMNAIPIDQDGVGKDGLQAILRRLEEGRAVLVFPEGTRTETGGMKRLQPGIHLLIRRVQAPIVPVGIAGAFDAWPKGRRLPTPAPLFLPAGPGTLAVTVGRPVDGGRYAKMPREEVLSELTRLLQAEQQAAERLRRR